MIIDPCSVFGCDEWGDYAGDVRHHEIACKHEAFPKFGTVYFCVYGAHQV